MKWICLVLYMIFLSIAVALIFNNQEQLGVIAMIFSLIFELKFEIEEIKEKLELD